MNYICCSLSLTHLNFNYSTSALWLFRLCPFPFYFPFIAVNVCCGLHNFCICSALGNSTISSSPPVAGERNSFSNVTRLGFAAGHDSPSLQCQETSSNTTTDSSVTTGIICLFNLIYSAC